MAPPLPAQPLRLHASGASTTLDLLGDVWMLRILREMFRGERRFSGFIESLGISRAVLSERLERLIGAGVLQREAVSGRHASYRLTDAGLDFWRVLLAMWQWEDRWGSGITPSQPRDRLRQQPMHTPCGHAADPQAVCASCGDIVTAFDTRAFLHHTAGEGDARAGERQRFRQSHSDRREVLPTLMRVYGDRWNASLMAATLQGARTFTQLSTATGMGASSLSARLKELQSMGMLRAHAYAGSRSEYRQTRAAIATFPITLEMMRWGDRWLRQTPSPLDIVHQPCQQALRLRWQCGHCKNELERQTLRYD